MTIFVKIAFAAALAVSGVTNGVAQTSQASQPAAVAQVLFWPQAKREAAFSKMETVFPTHTVKAGRHVHPLPIGPSLEISVTVDGKSQSLDQFMKDQKTAGVIVLQNGRIRLEKYALGLDRKGRWTSFSVAKSFTSTLVGAAVRDGYIQSIDDPVTRYIPSLSPGAYDGVTVRQVLTMTSGVRWNEDYTDPKSDVAQLFSVAPDPGVDSTVSYMRKLPREAAPGSKWVYKTGETNLIGVLVTSATRKSLAQYLSEKIWRPFGMEQDAVWIVDSQGQESGGCCLSISLRDYGRMGLFMLGGGEAGGKNILPSGWIPAATRKQADIGASDKGYGYQWWTEDNGTYDAYGIFGQAIHIDPKRRLVMVVVSAWPKATDPEHQKARSALFDAVTLTTDAESSLRRKS